MTFNNFNINRQYFIMTFHCIENAEDFGLKRNSTLASNEYVLEETGDKYYYINKAYDFGWGNEECWVLDQIYSFDDLIKLALHTPTKYDKNNIGAIDLIMRGSVRQANLIPEFLIFLKNHLIIKRDLNDENFKNLAFFFYDPWSDNIMSEYMNILDNYKDWLSIKKEVLEIVRKKRSILIL